MEWMGSELGSRAEFARACHTCHVYCHKALVCHIKRLRTKEMWGIEAEGWSRFSLTGLNRVGVLGTLQHCRRHNCHVSIHSHHGNLENQQDAGSPENSCPSPFVGSYWPQT